MVACRRVVDRAWPTRPDPGRAAACDDRRARCTALRRWRSWESRSRSTGRAPADPARRERLDAVKRWYAQDWLTRRREAALQHHREPQRLPLRLRPAGRRRDLLPAQAGKRAGRLARRPVRAAVFSGCRHGRRCSPAAAAGRGDRQRQGAVPEHAGRDQSSAVARRGRAAQAGVAPDAAGLPRRSGGRRASSARPCFCATSTRPSPPSARTTRPATRRCSR